MKEKNMTENKTMRVLFMGTPELARETLAAVYAKEGVTVVGVVTRADKLSGRGMKLVFSPVKEFALEHDIPVYQPKTLRDGAFQAVLDELRPEMIIVAAYGNILPHYVIEYPKYGCINAHGSLLPKYRGAAPIQRAIIDGERVTGITAMYMDDGLDTGDMILKLECPIADEDDFESVHDRLAALAGEAMCKVIDMTWDGCVPREKQDDALSTYAAKIGKEDEIIDFSRSPKTVVDLVRGLSPDPFAVTKTPDGKLLKITKAVVADGECDAPYGTVVALKAKGDGAIDVSCGGGIIRILGVVPEGKKKMPASAFVNGRKIAVGDVLAYTE